MVDALMQRLEEASIDASCAEERTVGELYLGGAPTVTIWVARADDLERAGQILREVEAERTDAKCPSCAYDLTGHSGRTVCPECGHDLHAPKPDVACPQCGEAIPADFEVCWSCGADVSA
jgi:ribosomal protein S27AE